MRSNSYWNIFKENICKNKVVFLSALITTVLCFGFTITSYSIGVDDPIRTHYLFSEGSGSMIQQGRLLHIVFNYLTGFVDFIPFFNDFIGAALFFLSALLFAALFQYVTDCRFSNLSIVAFCCIYISYSIINEKFIYNLDVIVTMISYCCTALSLMYSYRFAEEKSIPSLIKAVIMMVIAAGSYESFIFLYFCGVFAILILQMFSSDAKPKFKKILISGLKYALVLFLAIVIYYTVVYVVQIATDQYGIWERNNPWKNENGFINNFKQITKTIINDLRYFSYLPILEFALATAAGGVFFVYKSAKKKSLLPLICFGGLFVGNLFIHYFTGYVMYRTAQTFCFFIAFIALLLLAELKDIKFLKKPLIVFVVFIVLIQSADMNKWFYNDYQRYRKESFAVDSIATELVSEFDVSKPVVFVSKPKDGYLDNNDGPENMVNGNSIIYWGIGAFGTGKMHDIFEVYGYDFLIRPTDEQIAYGKKFSEDMPAWPSEGSIKEFNNIIVVKMAE